jgi:hypothetical protein
VGYSVKIRLMDPLQYASEHPHGAVLPFPSSPTSHATIPSGFQSFDARLMTLIFRNILSTGIFFEDFFNN